MMSMRPVLAALAAAAALGLAPLPVVAQTQGLPATSFNVVGSIGNLSMYLNREVPFWNETVPKESAGAIKVQLKSFTELGLKGPEIFRLVSSGTGNVAWRLVVPASSLPKNLIPPTATIWVGPGRHAVTYYLRRGELVNFVGVVERSDWQNESWTESGDIKELAADFALWSNPITATIAQASEAYRWALFDREPLAHWSQGHVTLIGDACHPMLPFLAQGAVMAIEDAWVLSRKLKSNKEIAAALTAYEADRKPRTTRAQRGARRQTGIYHKQGVMAQLATYGPMWLAARLTPGVVHARQDWLYKFDVTA